MMDKFDSIYADSIADEIEFDVIFGAEEDGQIIEAADPDYFYNESGEDKYENVEEEVQESVEEEEEVRESTSSAVTMSDLDSFLEEGDPGDTDDEEVEAEKEACKKEACKKESGEEGDPGDESDEEVEAEKEACKKEACKKESGDEEVEAEKESMNNIDDIDAFIAEMERSIEEDEEPYYGHQDDDPHDGVHSHTHCHGDYCHNHPHSHDEDHYDHHHHEPGDNHHPPMYHGHQDNRDHGEDDYYGHNHDYNRDDFDDHEKYHDHHDHDCDHHHHHHCEPRTMDDLERDMNKYDQEVDHYDKQVLHSGDHEDDDDEDYDDDFENDYDDDEDDDYEEASLKDAKTMDDLNSYANKVPVKEYDEEDAAIIDKVAKDDGSPDEEATPADFPRPEDNPQDNEFETKRELKEFTTMGDLDIELNMNNQGLPSEGQSTLGPNTGLESEEPSSEEAFEDGDDIDAIMGESFFF